MIDIFVSAPPGIAFFTLSIGPVFSLLDTVLADRFGMLGGPMPRKERFVVRRPRKKLIENVFDISPNIKIVT